MVTSVYSKPKSPPPTNVLLWITPLGPLTTWGEPLPTSPAWWHPGIPYLYDTSNNPCPYILIIPIKYMRKKSTWRGNSLNVITAQISFMYSSTELLLYARHCAGPWRLITESNETVKWMPHPAFWHPGRQRPTWDLCYSHSKKETFLTLPYPNLSTERARSLASNSVFTFPLQISSAGICLVKLGHLWNPGYKVPWDKQLLDFKVLAFSEAHWGGGGDRGSEKRCERQSEHRPRLPRALCEEKSRRQNSSG